MYKKYNCLFCKKEKEVGKTKRNKFCSLACQANYQFEFITKPKIENNQTSEPKTLKRYLYKIRENKCEICDLIPEWMGKPLVLQLDHIDGNSDNNFPSNLRLICPNCHSQTDNFCSKGYDKNNPKKTKRNSYNRKFKNIKEKLAESA